MVLIERTTVLAAALPLQVLKDQLRLANGFSEDTLQDGLLENMLRAAMAAVESRTGKVVLEHGFTWSLNAWRDVGSQPLPVAPVTAVTALRLRDQAGDSVDLDLVDYALHQDDQRPRFVALRGGLPAIPSGGRVELEFDAGFSPTWAGVPADLAHAVIVLAADYYDNRGTEPGVFRSFPTVVASLMERYRTVRLLGGGLS